MNKATLFVITAAIFALPASPVLAGASDEIGAVIARNPDMSPPDTGERPGDRALPVATQAELDARIASGPTPLDAFTPFGRREFLANIVWDADGGLGGFSVASIMRELTSSQVIDLLAFFGRRELGESMAKQLPDAPPLRFPEPSAEVENEWNSLNRRIEAHERAAGTGVTTEVGQRDVVAAYHRGLGARIRADALADVPMGDLSLLFMAAATVTWLDGEPSIARDMLDVFAELEARHVDTRRVFNDLVIKSLLASRQLEAARSFLQDHPDPAAAPIPRIVDELGPMFRGRSVLDPDADAPLLRREEAAIPPGRQVVLVVGPSCSKSSEALNAIRQDSAVLAGLSSRNLLVLTPPAEGFNLASIGSLRREFPEFQIRIP